MGPVALDAQGFVRVREGKALVFRQWAEMEASLRCAGYLKMDRAESEALTGVSDVGLAARHLAEYGPREVLVTQSSGVTLLAGGQVYEAPSAPRSLAGRTGRGDTCFCSYLGCRVSKPPGEAIRWAAATIATLKQEKPGPWRGTVSEVEALLRKPECQ